MKVNTCWYLSFISQFPTIRMLEILQFLFFIMVCFLSLLVHPGGVSDEKIFKEVYGPSVDFAGIPCIRQKQTNKKTT